MHAGAAAWCNPHDVAGVVANLMDDPGDPMSVTHVAFQKNTAHYRCCMYPNITDITADIIKHCYLVFILLYTAL